MKKIITVATMCVVATGCKIELHNEFGGKIFSGDGTQDCHHEDYYDMTCEFDIPDGVAYNQSFTAVPMHTPYRFSHWSGGLCNGETSPVCNVSLNSQMTANEQTLELRANYSLLVEGSWFSGSWDDLSSLTVLIPGGIDPEGGYNAISYVSTCEGVAEPQVDLGHYSFATDLTYTTTFGSGITHRLYFDNDVKDSDICGLQPHDTFVNKTFLRGNQLYIVSEPETEVFSVFERIEMRSDGIQGTWETTPEIGTQGWGRVTFYQGHVMVVTSDCIDVDDGVTVLAEAGIDYGTYTWNAETGAFSATMLYDANDECGLFDGGTTDVHTIKRKGDRIVITFPDDGVDVDETLMGMF